MARSPTGGLTADIFDWRETAVPKPQLGEVLVRTRLLSLDPANRAWMNGPSYREQVLPGDVMHGFTLSEVVESKAPGFAPGDLVDCMGGWQDYAVMPVQSLTKRDRRHDPAMLIGVLGVTGLTAYHGLFDIGRPAPWRCRPGFCCRRRSGHRRGSAWPHCGLPRGGHRRWQAKVRLAC